MYMYIYTYMSEYIYFPFQSTRYQIQKRRAARYTVNHFFLAIYFDSVNKEEISTMSLKLINMDGTCLWLSER
jgi:hypothetical protein